LSLGHLAAIAAFVLWGLFPFYWRQLLHVDSMELICHRIIWSFVSLMIGLLLLRKQTTLRYSFFRENPLRLLWSVFAAILIAINWLVFVRCVQTDKVLESSLGYFITPLMSVALGVCVLGERLRPIQWLAVSLAALGVVYSAIRLGTIPYLALSLAVSFGIYGIVKKRAPLAAIPGLWLETAVLLLPAIVYLANQEHNAFGAVNRMTDFWIVASGPVTTIPLLLFSYGAQRIPLSQLGLLQYIGPTLQFLVGWLVLHESVSHDRWIGFSLVWFGLLIFGIASRPTLLSQTLEPAVSDTTADSDPSATLRR